MHTALAGCRVGVGLGRAVAVLIGLYAFQSTGEGAEPAKTGTVAGEPSVDFQREIRPILADTCYTCHGPDKSQRSTDLRLDTREGAFGDLGGYKAIVPGRPAESEVIKRISSSDPDERMPPPKSGRQLNRQQIESLRRWIAEGAVWQDHWSFMPPQRPVEPEVRLNTWPRNALDRFVLAQLEKEGLSPSAEANKETLIRRVTLDLTGLPPTIAEIDAFLADSTADAYEKLVERLLASPRYGEHMAAAWLDAARYSDTNGYQTDSTRTMWPWRDWVVEAFNQNQPFDQFTVEQIAGDLLPDATDRQKLATGFNRNHPLNGEGGRIAEESRVEYVVDRVDATATVWLGLTAGCGRCHDHKYDPLSQREFYQLYAFFNNISESGAVDKGGNAAPVMAIRRPDPKIDQLETQIAAVRRKLEADSPEWTDAQAKWESSLNVQEIPSMEMSPWQSLGPFTANSPEEAFDKDFGPESAAPPTSPQRWEQRSFADGTPNQLDVPPSSAIYLKRTITATRSFVLPVSLGSDDGIKVWIGGRNVVAKDKRGGVKADEQRASLELQPGENKLLIKVNNDVGPGGFYFNTQQPGPPKPVLDALRRPAGERSAADQETIQRHFRALAPETKHLREQIAALEKQLAEQLKKSTVDAMIMQERPDPRKTFVLLRGQWDAPDDKQPVQPNVPACLPPLPKDAPHNRLGLARWLVDPANPLTARVTVNRFWQQFFGQGLVKTPEDFGSQGEPPTHPQMLDWLATEFIARGWNVKEMHRLIVTSATYRQSSSTSPELLERDPYNQRLARGPRFRLSSLALRDQALALSGLLVEKVGGPPVKPYQPAGVWLDFSLGQIDYVQDHGEALYRRSLYTFWRRSVAPTMLFDVSSRQVCTVRPSRTNSPLHSLTLLNDITYVEAARQFAARIMKEGGADPAARLNLALRMATSRRAQPRETAVLLFALGRATKHFRANPDAAQKLLKVGESPNDKALDPIELAAYTSVMNIVLNLDEVLTKE